MKKIEVLTVLLMAIMLAGCGRKAFNLNNAPYDPKIAVEAYLYPGRTVSDIKLMRNFPIGDTLDLSGIYLTPLGNGVTATINGTALSFDPQTQTYYDKQMTVDYNTSYTLDVYAAIDGVQLHATSTTLTPQKGFSVPDRSLGIFTYGDSISIDYLPSPGTSFYAFSIVPDTANTGNFIYNNSTLRKTLDSSQVAANLNQYEFRYGTVDNVNSFANTTYSFNVGIRNIFFYSTYTVVAYACDANAKDYILTAPNVQEIDGNFHEPVEAFQGDGIGVFGSAITDTVTFTVAK